MPKTKTAKNGWTLVSEFVKPDSKKRLSLGLVTGNRSVVSSSAYNVYQNSAGEVLLKPVVTVPADEAWLYKNKTALASVKRGLGQSKRGETHDLGSFAKYAND